MFKGYREISKGNWGHDSDTASLDQIKIGCLLRIADALELMSTNYAQLQKDRDYYKRHYEDEQRMHATERRRSAALRGVVRKRKPL